MKKHYILSVLFTLICGISMAQQPAINNDTDVTGRYDRTGYSFIVVETDTRYSNHLREWASRYRPIDKFDYNNIETKFIPKSAFAKGGTIANIFTKEKVGQQIVSQLFNRKPNGEMDDKIVRERGLYNATATDEMDANAASLGQQAILQDKGYLLLDKTYIMALSFYDYNTVGSSVQAKGACILYKLNLDNFTLNEEIFSKCWIYPEDDAATREKKNEYFKNLKFDFEIVTRVNVDIRSESTVDNKDYLNKLHNRIYQDLMYKLEMSHIDFTVQTPVLTRRPITARIGAKESVKNADRYDCYKLLMDKNNNVKAKRTGILRATTIANNTEDNKAASEFIQVAGYHVEEGYVLKQRNDHKMMLSPFYRSGALDGYGVNFDIMTHMKTNGSTGFGGIYASYSSYDIAALNAENSNYDYPDPYYDGAWSAINVGIRIGYSRRFLRYFEAGLYGQIGLDMLAACYDDTDFDAPDDGDGAGAVYSQTIGASVKINIKYPLHLTIGVDYSNLSDSGSSATDTESPVYHYNSMNSVLKDVGINREGVGYTIGLSYSF